MKKILTISILLIATNSWAWTQMFNAAGGPGNTGAVPASCDANCPSGVYKFFWDGDNTTSENHACITNCSASDARDTSDGTDRTVAGGQSGQMFDETAQNQYGEWTIAADDIIDDEIGTVWLSVYAISSTGLGNVLSSNMNVFEVSTDADSCTINDIQIILKNNGRVSNIFRSNNNNESVDNAAILYNYSDWSRIGYTWSVADTGDGKGSTHCVQKCDGDKTNCSGWYCNNAVDNSDTLVAFTVAADTLAIGDHECGGADGGEVYIDNVFVMSTFKATDPCSATLCP